MKKGIAVAALALLSFAAVAADTSAPLPREGKLSATQVLSGSVVIVPLGKDMARFSYDVMGIRTGTDESDLFHNATVRCIGALTMVNNAFDDESGNCVVTRPDGDQAISSYTNAGKVGAEAKGTWRFIAGTGKLAGIQGSGEASRVGFRPAAQGTTQSLGKVTGTYKLPAAAASR